MTEILEQVVRFDVPLASLTSFRIGGQARHYAEPVDRRELMWSVRWARSRQVPIFVLGGGTNTLIPDAGFSGLVLSMVSYTGITTRAAATVEGDDGICLLHVLAGTPLRRVIGAALNLGWQGLEEFVGIPGTVGGAIYGNAGTADVSIGQRVEELTLLDRDGQVHTVSGTGVPWRYRGSGLGRAIVAEATLGLRPGTVEEVKRAARERFQRRLANQPHDCASAGCVFRNPPGVAAGELIDRAGLKGAQIGGARVSERHANFIINTGGATASDVEALIDRIRSTIRASFGVELQHELVLPGSDLAGEEEADGTAQ